MVAGHRRAGWPSTSRWCCSWWRASCSRCGPARRRQRSFVLAACCWAARRPLAAARRRWYLRHPTTDVDHPDRALPSAGPPPAGTYRFTGEGELLRGSFRPWGVAVAFDDDAFNALAVGPSLERPRMLRITKAQGPRFSTNRSLGDLELHEERSGLTFRPGAGAAGHVGVSTSSARGTRSPRAGHGVVRLAQRAGRCRLHHAHDLTRPPPRGDRGDAAGPRPSAGAPSVF